MDELGSDTPMGAIIEKYASIIADHLADENKQNKHLKYFDKVGYRATQRKL